MTPKRFLNPCLAQHNQLKYFADARHSLALFFKSITSYLRNRLSSAKHSKRFFLCRKYLTGFELESFGFSYPCRDDRLTSARSTTSTTRTPTASKTRSWKRSTTRWSETQRRRSSPRGGGSKNCAGPSSTFCVKTTSYRKTSALSERLVFFGCGGKGIARIFFQGGQQWVFPSGGQKHFFQGCQL